MLCIQPLPPTVPLPDAPPALCEGRIRARVEHVLASTRGKLHQAVRALVWRLAVHPSQGVGRWRYTELSVGYIAAAAGVGRETAREAWHLLREAVGWWAVRLHRARAMGVQVRRLAPGGRWGQHLMVSPEAAQVVEAIAAERDLRPAHTAIPDAPGWLQLRPVRRGRHLMACCPWHEDTTPSMLLNPNPDGSSGSAVCFACTDAEGRPLRAYWRREGAACSARLARRVVPLRPAIPASGTIHNQGPAALGPGAYLLAHSSAERGMRRSASRCSDLIGLLRTADRRSETDKAAGEAMAALYRDESPGDSYVSVERMATTGWRTLHTRRGEVRVPCKWEPTEVRWLLADLDGFDDAPFGDGELAVAGQALARWAQSHPGLTGRVAVIRTSHHGVQVIAELDGPKPDPRGWHSTAEARALTRALDAAALAAAHGAGFAGGHADPCVHAAGRLMRRPGWRLDKRGELCRARLAWASE